jgi:hypothetical protein
MKKIYFFIQVIFFALLSLGTAQAQFGTGNPQKIKYMQNRKLIIVVEQESVKMVELLRKKRRADQIDLYKSTIRDYNVAMQEAVEKFWPYGKGPDSLLYMTYDEADRLRKTKTKEYAVLYCANVENFTFKGEEGGRKLNGISWSDNFKVANSKRDHWEKYAVMEIKLIEELGKSEPVFTQNLANVLPEKADVVFGLRVLQYYLQEQLSKSNGGVVKMEDILKIKDEGKIAEKTLLLRRNWVHSYLSEGSVKAIYNFPFEIVEPIVFNNRALDADSAYAILMIIPEVISRKAKIKVNYMHLIIDAADGSPITSSIINDSEKDQGKMIEKANFRDYQQSAKGHASENRRRAQSHEE